MSASQSTPVRPSFVRAAATSAALSLLFVVVYGGCNWITAHRTNVGTWYYAWERYIPFVPWMIVPYMSIDLFFAAAPFLCGSREELRTFTRRVASAILIAGSVFLLLPLHMGTPLPEPEGWTHAIFKFLHGFDQPSNLFPSLHIALRTILADLYARHTKGPLRWASHIWFSLIGFSTLLTYQHHFVDVAGGFVLAAICFYLFREGQSRLPVVPNRRIALHYAVGAATAAALAAVGWPWTAILLWPAVALGIVAVGYLGLGPALYRKAGGRLPLSARLLLAPCLLGQHLSLLHYRRGCAPWNEITPHVWAGVKLREREALVARRRGVTAVLDLTAEFSEAPAFLELPYLNIPMLDLTRLSRDQLQAAVAFIRQHAAEGIVYVHCKVGYSRTAAAVGAYLLATGQASSAENAVALLKQARPSIIVRPEAWAALQEFEHLLAQQDALG